MERLQKEFQTTRFVKAFNSVGYQQLIDPQLADGPPTMFICGNDADAKRDVSDLLSGLGWRSEEHTSELQSLMRISYAVFCLKKKNLAQIKTRDIVVLTVISASDVVIT